MRRQFITALLLFAPCAGVAAAQDTTQNQTRDTSMQRMRTDDQHQMNQDRMSDEAVLMKMHKTNLMEIRLGQLAQRNARSARVKSYGQRLVRDHQASDQKVTTVAQQLGITLRDDMDSTGHPMPGMRDRNRQNDTTQMGNRNRDTTQMGNRNRNTDTTQMNRNRYGDTTQMGNRNRTDTTQMGNRNRTDTTQMGNRNRYGDTTQMGKRNPTDTMQMGNRNRTDTTQMGNRNRTDTTQMGNRNQYGQGQQLGQGQQDDTTSRAEHARIAKLATLRGAAFDTAFANIMVQGHEKAIAMLERAQDQVQREEVKSLISSTLPTLKEHRRLAEQLVNPSRTTSSN
jgi:predicted outer membrane protein